MRPHYDPTRPLKTPPGGWPKLSYQSAQVLNRVADLLSTAASYSETLDPKASFACLYDVLETVGAQMRAGGVVALCGPSLDDPLTLFSLDYAALCFVLDEFSLKRMKRKLEDRNCGLPKGLDCDDLRSKPLVALHKVINVLNDTVDGLVALKARKKRPSGAVH